MKVFMFLFKIIACVGFVLCIAGLSQFVPEKIEVSDQELITYLETQIELSENQQESIFDWENTETCERRVNQENKFALFCNFKFSRNNSITIGGMPILKLNKTERNEVVMFYLDDKDEWNIIRHVN